MRTKSPELAARIGENIKAVRNAANLQQYAVADLAWHKPTYAERVSNIEHGKHTPSLFTLARISNALSVDIDWLVSGNPDNIVYTNKSCEISDVDELAVNIAMNMREMCKDAKWSGIDAASLIGVSRTQYYAYANARYLPSVPVAVKIAKVFGCTLKDLIEE